MGDYYQYIITGQWWAMFTNMSQHSPRKYTNISCNMYGIYLGHWVHPSLGKTEVIVEPIVYVYDQARDDAIYIWRGSEPAGPGRDLMIVTTD